MDFVRERLARLIWDTPNLDWLLLTKRIENAKEMIYQMWFPDAEWPKNYWIGTTVENQEQADRRIPQLLQVPAKVRFLSMEPQLEEIDLSKWLDKGIHWVIQGGESGSKARFFDLKWARKMREQCKEARVAYFLKQLGSKACDSFYLTDQRLYLKDSHGGDMSEWPEDLRVREIPEVVI